MPTRYRVTQIVRRVVYLDATDAADAAEQMRMHLVCDQPTIDFRTLKIEEAEGRDVLNELRRIPLEE